MTETHITIPKIITLVLLLTFIFGGLLFVTPAKADIIYYGSNYNFSISSDPNNTYVKQGDNISQYNYYDLSGLYGFSGIIGHWNNDDDVGYTQPDYTNSLAHPYGVYIDPIKWPLGRWYQIDDASAANATMFAHGNNFVFAVARGTPPKNNITNQSNVSPQVGPTPTAVDQSGSHIIQISPTDSNNVTDPIPTQDNSVVLVTETAAPETNSQISDNNGVVINVAGYNNTNFSQPAIADQGTDDSGPVDSNGIPIVTPRTPLNPYLVLLALCIIGGYIKCRN